NPCGKVSVDRDHQFTVTIRLHLLGILENTTGNGGTSNGWTVNGRNWKSIKSFRQNNRIQSRIGRIRVSGYWIMQGM
ncbi:MAG: hypothetical protein IPJ47_14195, partial [Anaerolineales bacterium]|nr:hypothetical protein [Anaerolineales bacterium]